jgi:hypothetical protein
VCGPGRSRLPVVCPGCAFADRLSVSPHGLSLLAQLCCPPVNKVGRLVR